MSATPHHALHVALAVFVSLCASSSAIPAEQILVAIDSRFDIDRLVVRDAKPSIVVNGNRHVLRLETGHRDSWPGITIRPTRGTWDASEYKHLAVELRNAGDSEVHVGMRADSMGGEGRSAQVQQILQLDPGEQGELILPLDRKMPARLANKLFGMRGYPDQLHHDKGIDPARVDKLLLFSNQPKQDNVIEVGDIRVGGKYECKIWLAEGEQKLFPMIDRFGQYMHKSWPGKTESETDLQRRRDQEAADLTARPGPDGWNQYGGWEAGPQLAATGRFRVQKHEGKWWLVDPAGRLFWSHGIDCVRPTTAYTPITDRKFLFADLPAKDSPLAQFYGHGSWAPHGYYQDKNKYETFNFTGANLSRKYGPDWRSQTNDLCHRRLRSWGMNTIANWSDAEIYLLQRTPYVVTVGSGRTRLEGSTGYWGKFPDPFDPEFAATTRRNMAQQKQAAGSAWCVGVFVDNEIAWGDELSLAVATLASPRNQAAKQQFVAELKAKYGSIKRLNDTWNSDYATWDGLLDSQTAPDADHAREDLAAFYTTIAEQYFKVCHDAVKETVPQTLYLGCRFAWVNPRAIRAAAKYCDVIGFNKYAYSVADFEFPEGIDAPAIIGEFHFGALDRGMFHTGLRRTANQAQRAEAYKNYVHGALKNRFLVGTHWFQFGDQATTGRGDGENYQIGFLDVCDTPYPETVQASREVGAEMYRMRLEK